LKKDKRGKKLDGGEKDDEPIEKRKPAKLPEEKKSISSGEKPSNVIVGDKHEDKKPEESSDKKVS
jgi:hypothetical protein